ncbi:hypothetical protein POTOM_014070 [Populus tomentosa]|uniref:Uncharacterized protein n=1 Tax=Populus tomentosa TaxID=118781 RepID=A0A8X8A604_POPTO|nr:hypothetical protein POTOM_014070 [Populus tomentosa]
MAIKPLTHDEIANTEKKLDMPLDFLDVIDDMSFKFGQIKNQKMFNNPAHEKALKMQRYMDSRPLVRQAALAQRRSNFQRNQFLLTYEAARKAAVAPFRNRSFGRNFMANANNASSVKWIVITLWVYFHHLEGLNRVIICGHQLLLTTGLCPFPYAFRCLVLILVAESFFIVSGCRAGGFTVQRRAANGGFAMKSPPRPNQQQQQGDGGAKQRPQTLDSLFANMKEQRMKVFSRQNKVVQHNGGGRRPKVPWARGRF